MPSQPDDPLHYEMKIPPEPESLKPKDDSGKADSKDETKPSGADSAPTGSGKNTDAGRRDDKS